MVSQPISEYSQKPICQQNACERRDEQKIFYCNFFHCYPVRASFFDSSILVILSRAIFSQIFFSIFIFYPYLLFLVICVEKFIPSLRLSISGLQPLLSLTAPSSQFSVISPPKTFHASQDYSSTPLDTSIALVPN